MDKVIRCTQLAFKALALVDEGESLDIDETRKHAEDGTLLSWLEDEFGGRIDFVFYEDADKAELSDRFASLANAASATDLGIENNGLALVAAYCLEVIQEDRQRA
jgi:hypothetical protein